MKPMAAYDVFKIVSDIINRYPGEINPYLIMAQIWQESRFVPSARSDHGAVGLMQLMPETAKEMGLVVLKPTFEPILEIAQDERLDPVRNLRAGIKYQMIQFIHFPEVKHPGERWKFALAAYNGGRGNVNRAIKLYGNQGRTVAEELAWAEVSPFLLILPSCDGRQMIDYVEKIYDHLVTLPWGKFSENKE